MKVRKGQKGRSLSCLLALLLLTGLSPKASAADTAAVAAMTREQAAAYRDVMDAAGPMAWGEQAEGECLKYAELLDFNGDGIQELVLLRSYSARWEAACEIQVWSWDGNQIFSILRDNCGKGTDLGRCAIVRASTPYLLCGRETVMRPGIYLEDYNAYHYWGGTAMECYGLLERFFSVELGETGTTDWTLYDYEYTLSHNNKILSSLEKDNINSPNGQVSATEVTDFREKYFNQGKEDYLIGAEDEPSLAKFNAPAMLYNALNVKAASYVAGEDTPELAYAGGSPIQMGEAQAEAFAAVLDRCWAEAKQTPASGDLVPFAYGVLFDGGNGTPILATFYGYSMLCIGENGPYIPWEEIEDWENTWERVELWTYADGQAKKFDLTQTGFEEAGWSNWEIIQRGEDLYLMTSNNRSDVGPRWKLLYAIKDGQIDSQLAHYAYEDWVSDGELEGELAEYVDLSTLELPEFGPVIVMDGVQQDQIPTWMEETEPLLAYVGFWMAQITGPWVEAVELSDALKTYHVPKAQETSYQILVDGKAVGFSAYALQDEHGNDTNYLKLRDVAYTLNGTNAQFDVAYDGTIQIATGRAYQPNGTEMSAPFIGNQPYQVNTNAVMVNGEPCELEAILLTDSRGNGYTYFKLRDLGTALGFDVGWDGTNILIHTVDKTNK